MSLLSRLFGGGGSGAAKPAAEAEVYKDFRIYAEPTRTGGGYRVSARIEKDVDGVTRSHQLIRADVLESEEAARDYTLRKARILIDEQGEALLDA
jgi:hypothetical protein